MTEEHATVTMMTTSLKNNSGKFSCKPTCVGKDKYVSKSYTVHWNLNAREVAPLSSIGNT